MPPRKSGKVLTPHQIELLKKWIDQGAKWNKHWAFEPPRRPAAPSVKECDWPRNPIDAFVLARLESEKLAHSPPADKAALIRRVYLDLTGLPPSPAEVDGFLADAAPDAYEKLVDRLLASPAYGERMAMDWLDGARYADTNGYQNDFARTMWPWRNWVIAAFNANEPFDRFTIEQIAGDLLPGADLSQRIATGFNRNNRTVTEAGSIEEEWHVENTDRPDRDDDHGVPRAHDGMRPMPRPQVRPDLAGRVLPVLRLLQQHQREGRLHRDSWQRAPADLAAPDRRRAASWGIRPGHRRGEGVRDQEARRGPGQAEGRVREGHPVRHGDGGDGQAPSDLPAEARPVRPARQVADARARHSRLHARACPPDAPRNRLGLARWLVSRGQSAHRPGRGQPDLAAPFRHGTGEDRRELRRPGRAAVAPGAARLAGHRAGPHAAGTSRRCTG